MSALQWAAARGHESLVKLLFKKGVDVNNIPGRYRKRRSALYLAAEHGHRDIVKYLLDNGADPNAIEVHGIRDTRHPLFNWLNFSRNPPQDTLRLLLEGGVDVNFENMYGLRPLHVGRGVETAQMLLEFGAEINAQDQYGETALHTALRGHFASREVAEFLVKKGANVTLVERGFGCSPLHFAAENDVEMVRLVVQNGGMINLETMDNNGMTPLFYAGFADDPDVVVQLLEYGANPTIRASEGYIAAETARCSITGKLLQDAAECWPW